MFIPNKKDVKIYTAGKTWHAKKFKELRDKHGFNITARWIDLQKTLQNYKDTFSQETHENEEYKRSIWEEGCKLDSSLCDFLLLYCEPVDGNMLSGALVEIGHATGFGKPVYQIGTCESVEPVGNSDRAWSSQSIYFKLGNIGLVEGAHKALKHYQEHFSRQWLRNQVKENSLLDFLNVPAIKKA